MFHLDLKKQRVSEYFYADIAAAALGVFLLVFLAITARYTVGTPDESYYCTIPQRILQGDRLITDDWSLSQFVFILNVPVYWLYTHIAGGTDGILLFMRFYFIALNSLYYIYLYKKLRRFGLRGAIAAFLFCAVIPQTILAVCYFTVSTAAVMAVLLTLALDEKKKSPPALVLTGAVLALGVMSEPFLLFAFGLWFIAVVIHALREKRGKPFFDEYAFILDKTVFFYVTVGTVIVFALFMGLLIKMGSFTGLSAVLPYLFTGMEYNKSNIINIEKITSMVPFFSPVFLAGLLLCLIASAVIRIRRVENPVLKRQILVLAMIFTALCFIHGAVKSITATGLESYIYFYEYHGVPLMIFSPIPLLLSKKPDPRLFAVCIASILCSVCIDVSSFVILGCCARITALGLVLGFPAFIGEFNAVGADNGKAGTKKQKAKNAALLQKERRLYAVRSTAIAVCTVVFLIWEAAHITGEGVYKPPEIPLLESEEPMDCVLDAGPYKNLRTVPQIKEMYNGSLKDLETIREAAAGAPAAILNDVPFMYLHLQLPYATFSAWYENETDRLYRYWLVNPSHQPAYVYLPFYDCKYYTLNDEKILDHQLKELFNYIDGEAEKGEMGYIIRVTGISPDK